jgi:hypothetical protein
MVKASVKGNLNVLSAHGKTTRAAIVITIQSAPIVANLTWLHRKIVIISCKKKRSKKLNQKQRPLMTSAAVLEEVKDHLPVSNIQALYRCGEAKDWYFTFDSPSIVDEVGDTHFIGKSGAEVEVERIDKRRVRFRVHWYPFFMDIGSIEQHLYRFGSPWEDHEGCDCNNNPKFSNCGQPHMASSKNCHYFLQEKEVQKVKSETIIIP